jgi:hypothetical protein
VNPGGGGGSEGLQLEGLNVEPGDGLFTSVALDGNPIGG